MIEDNNMEKEVCCYCNGTGVHSSGESCYYCNGEGVV